ncbi:MULTISPECIES: PadR family transcriptional regulator [unclassified Nocardiopsis]|uniref:PadR family transcriptional regulator n=1 Tax=unclassified Nocardiopsis TaxID=2649073 RepID=UPI00066C143F|nr:MULTISPECIES: PadR family transcriptional regulator [unclassified Nocardiopsis]MBQ1083845.1 PadR family transcriptional regulator [Nocardiopsis sp. B62]
MTAMALPGPWPWGGQHSERPRLPWAWRPTDTPRAHHDPRDAHDEHRGPRRDGFGHPPPEPPRPPHPPWGAGPVPGGPFGGPGGPAGSGGPFGPGFPFGGGHGHRRGGTRARRGDVRTGILMLLAEETRSGYEIIREGRERSGGAWRPSPGSVYPMLQQLEDEGLVAQVEGEGRRRPYQLTDEGIAYLEENGADLTPPWEAGADAYADARSRYEEISTLAYQLSAAASQVAQAGTPEQLERAKRLLADTKRGLYLILADDDGGGVTEGADTTDDED